MSFQIPVNFDNTTPAALSGYQNVVWQSDSNGNLSAYLPAATSSLGGAVPTPPNTTNEYLRGDATFAQPHLTDDADVSISSPQNGQVLTYVSASSNWQNVTPSSGGGGSTFTGDIGHRFQWIPLPSTSFGGSSFYGLSPWDAVNSNWNNGTNPGASPSGIEFFTSATASSSSGMCQGGSTGSGSLSLATLTSIVFVVKLGQTTNMRIWMGLAQIGGSGGQASTFRSDTPGTSTSLAMFRYSTNAGDSKYQCVTGNGTAQTVTPESTSSHVDSTTIHRFMIQYSAPNVIFYIDGVQVGSQSTDAPSSSTNLLPQIYIDNVATTNNQNFNIYGIRGQFAQL